MNERVFQFGYDKRLSGVLNTPENARANAPAILLFNAGVVHRVGAHRLNVKIARRLAQEGYTSFRFDLSGLGDSPPSREALGYEQQSIEDIKSALNFLEAETGARSAVAIGMCSGADNAYRAAVVEPRLAGAVLLDPYAYETMGARIGRFAERAANPDRWMRKIKKIAGADQEPAEETPEPPAPVEAIDDDREAPPPEEFGADLQAMTTRGCKVLILYTAYVKDKLTKPAQFFQTFSEFDFAGNIVVEASQDVDHTYTGLAAQAAFLDRLSNWLGEHWG